MGILLYEDSGDDERLQAHRNVSSHSMSHMGLILDFAWNDTC